MFCNDFRGNDNKVSARVIEAMTLQQAQQVAGGIATGDQVLFSAVSTDTRTLAPGELFVALTGPHFNGNRFVAVAAQKGACAAVVSEPVAASLPLLQVADTRIALGQLGAHNRRRAAARVIALTGSQGKTTVKEMTAAILGCAGAVLSTQGNLNNDYGVPLTLLRIDDTHRFAVIEMGANAAGEIAYVTRLAQPDIALITNVAPTHLEGFGSLEGVARAKTEIWQGLSAGGIAIVNLDDAGIADNFSAANGVRKLGISAAGKPEADYAIEQYTGHGLAGAAFVIRTPFGTCDVQLQLPGRHNAANALAAVAMALEAGASLSDITQGLATVRSVNGRLHIRRGKHGAVLIDDTYNASPASFDAAISVLVQQPGKHIVIAGDMGETGAAREQVHSDLGRHARAAGVTHFIGTGPLMALAVTAFGSGGIKAADCDAAAAAAMPLLRSDAVVLIKGSRSAGMERVVQQLLEQGN